MICYTDGSCLKNGSKENEGGYGVVICTDNRTIVKTHADRYKNTTNNRMEMMAILYVMENFGPISPVVYSDSAYCVNTFNNWIFSWERKGWLKSDNKEPENLDLLRRYMELYNKGYRIDLRKCEGHSNDELNNLADALATGKIKPGIVENK